MEPRITFDLVLNSDGKDSLKKENKELSCKEFVRILLKVKVPITMAMKIITITNSERKVNN